MPTSLRAVVGLCIALGALTVRAQQAADGNSLKLPGPELAKPLLWEPYQFQLQASGGNEPYHWRVVDGAFPHGFYLNDNGLLAGILNDPGPFQFTALVTDNSRPPKEQKQLYILRAEAPLTIDWQRKAQVNGQRIDGSIKASNHTGRDFDLTFVVLAVNDIGRATAIGYQHFPLKKDTRDIELPFGDTLSPGNYAVNVDVVGEEPVSNRIFRARLAEEKKSITSGP